MRSILRLEALDGRALPSVTVAEAGGVLTITGDQQANNIEIRDTGGSGTDAVTVWVDGVQSDVTIDTAVDKIVLYARGGQDVVAYNLTGSFTGGTDRDVVIYLGNQDDTFTAALNGSIGADSDVSLKVYGGNGQDNLSVSGAGTADAPWTIDGHLTVKLYGGNGKDTVNVNYNGLISATGTFDLTVGGGNGKDLVRADVTAVDGSAGTLNAKVCGGNGVDDMGLMVHVNTDMSPDLTVNAELHGGLGKDIFDPTVISDNVTIVDPQVH
ncbi:MAG TPA: hypothetical protein VKD71_10540 [Gemmataceae bacterium]|nr:hypothetical protein [Gemmataceae bacterium]